MTGVVLMVAVPACGGEPDGTGDRVTRSDSAGVEIVVSSGPDQPLDWGFERELVLGGAETGPESFYTLSAAFVATDSLGEIFVLDYAASRVVMFSGEGEFVREFGREGEGPGEISFPGSLAVSASGEEIAVFDFGKFALVRYGRDGTVLPQTPFDLRPLPALQRHIDFFGDGMLALSELPASSDDEMANALFAVRGSDTTVVASTSFPAPVMVRYPTCGGGLRIPRLFETEIAWSTASESLVLSRTPRYELELYRGTDLVRRFGRDVPAREATEGLAMRELGEGFTINFGRGPCTIPPREMVEGRGFAPLVPWVQELTASPAGATWVRRKEVGPDPEGPIDVFDPTGAYVGTLPIGAPFPLMFLAADRFAAAETDELGITRLVVYRIEAPGPTGPR